MLNLPLILDIAIGLIFIYLVLSLFASEIQEIITTLLQWRAKHLKNSIEHLFLGTSKEEEDIIQTKALVDNLYKNPLIKSINHQSKDKITGLLKLIISPFSKVNDQNTAPSYIPCKTFAVTLLEELKIPTLSHRFSCLKFKKLQEKLIMRLGKIEGVDEKALENFNKNLEDISKDFDNKKYSLELSLLRAKSRFNEFIADNQSSPNTEKQELFDQKIAAIKNIFFDEKEFNILYKEMKLNLIYLAQLLDAKNHVKDKIINDLKEELGEDIAKKIEAELTKIPPSLKDSIIALAYRAQAEIATVEEDVEQLSKELEVWFDNSMERASGVYKRNAKGFAFLLGFFIAFAVNADSFHIINRLSTDGALRSTIVENASVIERSCQDLDCVQEQTKLALEKISLPIGWDQNNLQAQWGSNLELNTGILSLIKKAFFVISGWIISGVAISMGSSFWFELLGKFINVRNTGAKPVSSSENAEKKSNN
ncbi:hypothetical protein [Crocosphaera sp. XPORK-15E]|uniref:hypothetical protein n=1 Tax=Crocosphaera sp. XPORK-15E TaxID=3110247 RepID=UPI002B21B1A7|nr:hypothetical protein [Crocosphaera sp. XPORK-15E]MEA5536481.1 hypothetical protein [Crocosphaera sp. XPORK-15E]